MSDNTKKAPLKAVCIGECMVELSPAGDGLFRQAFAGDSYNTATYLARQFAPDVEVSYLTALGTSGLSLQMIDHFKAEGIGVDSIRKLDGKNPGLYRIENDASGERFFDYWRGQSAARDMFAGQSVADLVEELDAFDAIYLSGISLAILDESQRSNLMQALKQLVAEESCLVAYDPNHRPALWSSPEAARAVSETMAGIASLCLVGLEDDAAIMEEACDAEAVASRWQAWGTREVVVKDGGANCLIRQGEATLTIAPQAALSPVDTTGAGDSFAAGYVGARLTGKDPAEAAALAHRIAGQVIMHPGAVIARDLWQTID
ncbi:sugar kinase [Cohaesibacter sp. CAU 1516]|uniref:sugar kinase n=1 Tax=Cohaesibacter sp. CAU 1516 TaxID=2576038 RepID=UPI0010FE88CD|nr:sugar kinase [Cohaesibacter sp. CAU 1516]TLP43173.1 sugar kinase [Cohaesibacter sp. CAU 1516]